MLVVEAGESSPDSIFIRISGAILKLFRNPAFDWCWQTVAEAGCLGRRVFLCRGKLLGGSTCLNAQLTFRGAPRDYGWGDGWSADELAATFGSIELRRKEPMASCGMHVQLPKYQHELSRRFLGACGPEIHPDLAPRASFNDWGDRYDGGAGSEEHLHNVGFSRAARRKQRRLVVGVAGVDVGRMAAAAFFGPIPRASFRGSDQR